MELYDSDIKEKYLMYRMDNYKGSNDVQSIVLGLKTIIKKISDVEYDYDTPIAEANYETFRSMCSEICNANRSTQSVRLFEIAMYINWCVNNTNYYIDLNNRIKLNVDDLDNDYIIYKKYFKNFEDFISIIDCITQPKENEDISLIYRVITLLIFEGIEAKNIFELTKDGYNSNTGTIVFNGETTQLSAYTRDELNCFLKQRYLNIDYKNSKRYLIFNDNKLINITGNARILKSIQNIMLRYSKLYKEIKGKNKEITANSIYVSGLFYRTFLLQQEKHILDSNIGTILKKSYIKDYLQWKSVYYQ
ncbi:MAG: hypothetical protein RR847_04880 [Bacilli bacterium]